MCHIPGMVYRTPAAKADIENQRSFVRVSTSLTCHGRRMQSLSAPPRFRGQPVLASAGRRPSRQARLLGSLASIESKLDQLLAQTSVVQLAAEFPLELEVTELSGAGMRARRPAEPLAPGDVVEVVLVLNHAPLQLASAVAQVVRTQERELVFAFPRILENHRKAIIQFVLEEQREQRRAGW
jgi:hypothetical protein